MLVADKTYTPAEAAVASGVGLKTVHREIDEGPLRSKRKTPQGKRSLDEQDLFYLAVANTLDTRLVQLTSKGKESLRTAIITHLRGEQPKQRFPVFAGGLSLDLRQVFQEVRS